MNLKNFLLSAVCGAILFTLHAEDPVSSLTALRDAVIKNDSVSAMTLTGDNYTKIIIEHGIPKDLRHLLFHLTGAFEDTSIRQQNPDKAEIYASVQEDDQTLYYKFYLEFNGSAFNLIRYSRANPPEPAVYLRSFFNCLQNGQYHSAKTYLSDELQTGIGKNFPLVLQLKAPLQIISSSNSGKDRIFKVKRMGVAGSITLSPRQMLWQISAIDPALLEDNAAMTAMRFAGYCSVFAEQYQKISDELFNQALQKNNSGKDIEPVQEVTLNFINSACINRNDEAINNSANGSLAKEIISKLNSDQTAALKYQNFTATVEMINFASENDAEVIVKLTSPDQSSISYRSCQAKMENDKWSIHAFPDEAKDIDAVRQQLRDPETLTAGTSEILLAFFSKSRHLFHPEFIRSISGLLLPMQDGLEKKPQLKLQIVTQLAKHVSSLAGFKSLQDSIPENSPDTVKLIFSCANSSTAQLILGKMNNSWLIKNDPAVISILKNTAGELERALNSDNEEEKTANDAADADTE